MWPTDMFSEDYFAGFVIRVFLFASVMYVVFGEVQSVEMFLRAMQRFDFTPVLFPNAAHHCLFLLGVNPHRWLFSSHGWVHLIWQTEGSFIWGGGVKTVLGLTPDYICPLIVQRIADSYTFH